jgi:hypothetical protein
MQPILKQRITLRILESRGLLVHRVQNCQTDTAKRALDPARYVSKYSLAAMIYRDIQVQEANTISSCETCATSFTQKRSAVEGLGDRERRFHAMCAREVSLHAVIWTIIPEYTLENDQFSWRICRKRFTHLSKLMRCLKLHSEKIHFSCEVCKKSLSQRSNLYTHLRVHCGDRHFSWDVCQKVRSTKWPMQTSRSTHW